MTFAEKLLSQKSLIFSMGIVLGLFLGSIGYELSTWDAMRLTIPAATLMGLASGFVIGCALGLLVAAMNVFIYPKFRVKEDTVNPIP